VVELPLTQYDSSCGVEHVLSRLDVGCSHAVEDTVTVVYPTSNERVHHGCGTLALWLSGSAHFARVEGLAWIRQDAVGLDETYASSLILAYTLHYNVIHKTGNTQRIALPSEDRGYRGYRALARSKKIIWRNLEYIFRSHRMHCIDAAYRGRTKRGVVSVCVCWAYDILRGFEDLYLLQWRKSITCRTWCFCKTPRSFSLKSSMSSSQCYISLWET